MSEISSIYFGNKVVQSIETKNGVLYGGDKFIYEEYTDSDGVEGYKIVGSTYKRKDRITNVVIPREHKHKPVIAIETEGDLLNDYSFTINSLTMPSSIKKISGGAFSYGRRFKNFYFDGTINEWGNIDFNDETDCPHNYCSAAEVEFSYFKNSLTGKWEQIDNSNGTARVEWESGEVKKYTFAFGVFIKQKTKTNPNIQDEYKYGFELYLKYNQLISIKEYAFYQGWCNRIVPRDSSSWQGYQEVNSYSFYMSKLLEFITPQNQSNAFTVVPNETFSHSLISIADFHTSKLVTIRQAAFDCCSVLRTIKFSDSVNTSIVGGAILRGSDLCDEIYVYSSNIPTGYTYHSVYQHKQEEPSIYFTYVSNEGVSVHLKYVGENSVILEYLDMTPDNIRSLTLPSEFIWNNITCTNLSFQWNTNIGGVSEYSLWWDYTLIEKVFVETNFSSILYTSANYSLLIENRPTSWSVGSVKINFNGTMRELVSKYWSQYRGNSSTYHNYVKVDIKVKENNTYRSLFDYISIEGTDKFNGEDYLSNRKSFVYNREISKLRITDTFNSYIQRDAFVKGNWGSIDNIYCDSTDLSKVLNYFNNYPNTSYGSLQNPMPVVKNLYINDPNGDEELEGNTYSKITELTIPNTVTELNYGLSILPSNLTKLTIPVEVTTIKNNSFYFLSYSTVSAKPNIYYEGTMAQWQSITKETYYKKYVPSNFKIHCSDGDINL